MILSILFVLFIYFSLIYGDKLRSKNKGLCFILDPNLYLFLFYYEFYVVYRVLLLNFLKYWNSFFDLHFKLLFIFIIKILLY